MLENTPDINTYQSLLTLMESLFQVSSKYRSSLILSEDTPQCQCQKETPQPELLSNSVSMCTTHRGKSCFPLFSCQSTCNLGVMLSVLEYHSVSGEI